MPSSSSFFFGERGEAKKENENSCRSSSSCEKEKSKREEEDEMEGEGGPLLLLVWQVIHKGEKGVG